MLHFWAKSLPYSLQPRRLQRPPAGFIFAKRPLPTAFWPAPNLERPNYWPFWTLMAISSRNFLYNRAIFKMRLGKFVGLGKGYQGKEFLVCSITQNLHWKLGQLMPSFGSILAVRLKKLFFRNKTFLFFKIESWNFQKLFEKEFCETSQSFNSFSLSDNP